MLTMYLRRATVLVAVATACTLLVACGGGGSDDGGSTAAAGGGSTTSSAGAHSKMLPPEPSNTDGADVRAAQQVVLDALKPTRFDPPGDPVDPSRITRSIWIVTCGGGNLYCKTVAQGAVAAANAAGVRAQTFVSDDPARNAVGVRTAVSRGAGAIILVAVDPKSVAKPLAEAQAAGVKIVSTANTNRDQPPLPGTDANATVDFSYEGMVNAAYAVAARGADLNAYCATTLSFPTTRYVCDAFKAELARLCPNCQYSEGDYNLTSLAQDVRSGIQSKIQSDPKLNWVMCTTDLLCQYAVPAIQAVGAKDRVSAGSQTGQLVPNLGWVRDGNTQLIDVGLPQSWNGWSAVDQALRLMTGEKPAPGGGNLPVVTFTHESLAARPELDLTVGKDTSNEEAAYGTDGGKLYQDVYKRLWGIN